VTAGPADAVTPDPPEAHEPALTPSAALTDDEALELLRHGRMELEGRLVDASNTTLRAFLTGAGRTVRCVYKPVRGERPLWDFPDGTLAGREVAAYLVSRTAGWNVVPPTVLRDGPLGRGACQLWIDEPDDVDPLVGFVPVRRMPAGWFRIMSARDDTGRSYALAHADDARLASLAVFDAVVNNADRKGGHVLLDARDRLYGVDHGVCFHTDGKLRTILWGWADEPLPAAELEVLGGLAAALAGALGDDLAPHVTAREVRAAAGRIDRLRETGRFPLPSPDWPAVPWPPI
jgi:uncharacterized repeat protein (TIGR03843 family)